MKSKHPTDAKVIAALRTGNGYPNYAAQQLNCPQSWIMDRIHASPRVAKVFWAIDRARKRSQGTNWRKRPSQKHRDDGRLPDWRELFS